MAVEEKYRDKITIFSGEPLITEDLSGICDFLITKVAISASLVSEITLSRGWCSHHTSCVSKVLNILVLDYQIVICKIVRKNYSFDGCRTVVR